MAVPESAQSQTLVTCDGPFDADAWRELEDELLQASQGEYATYRDKLALTERHLDTLIEDTDGALKILASLAESFRAVEEQTSSFKAQCDDLLSEQRRLEKIADDVRSDFYYYAYLEEVTRRLNAPGASRLADGAPFAEMLTNLEACIEFMLSHVCGSYAEAIESPPAAYSLICTTLTCHDHLIHSPHTAMPNHTRHAIKLCSPKPCICSKSASPHSWIRSRGRYQSRSRRHNLSLPVTRLLTVASRR